MGVPVDRTTMRTDMPGLVTSSTYASFRMPQVSDYPANADQCIESLLIQPADHLERSFFEFPSLLAPEVIASTGFSDDDPRVEIEYLNDLDEEID